MIAKTANNYSCVVCGIPLDAEYFDVNGFVGRGSAVDVFQNFHVGIPHPISHHGEQGTPGSFHLYPPNYGGRTSLSLYFVPYTRDKPHILTPGFEWIITQNGKPVFPYTRMESIANPWGYNCLPVMVRLDENARVEFILRNRSISNLTAYPIKAFAGRIMGRYWYNE